jgi:S1-C subfamily serine protease
VDASKDGSPWWWDDRGSGEESARQAGDAAFGDTAIGDEPPPAPGVPPAPIAGNPRFYQGGQGWADPWGNRPRRQSWSEPATDYYGQPGFGQLPPRRRAGRSLLVAAAVVGLVAAAVAGGFAGRALTTSGRSTAASGSGTNPSSGGFGSLPGRGSGGGVPSSGSGSTTPPANTTGPSDAATIASRVDPGLVDVNTVVDYGQAQAGGTGMVLTANGEVLTNNHVIDGATSISVTDVGNGQTYQARVVGYSVTNDVAVLQLTGASGLQTVTTASAAASVGEQVVGIGNAGGTGGTPSYAGGAVTATDQSITAIDDLTGTDEQLTGMIETNADIQAGDSGGPLVNDSGQVIGMDTAGSQTFQFGSDSQGSGYAIPIATATSVASQILAGGSSSSVHIGPTAFLGIQVGGSGGFGRGNGGYGGFGSNPVSGVPVGGVLTGSPAANAGLVEGDVVTSVGGYAVASQNALQQVMTTDLSPGQVVTVQYTDGAGEQQSVTLTLASGPPA